MVGPASASQKNEATNGMRRPPINRYQPSIPRVVLGIAAVAMTAVTFGLLVVMPATNESSSEDVRAQAATKVVTPAATEVVIIPARIEVLGFRETELASTPSTTFDPSENRRADHVDLPRRHLPPRVREYQ